MVMPSEGEIRRWSGFRFVLFLGLFLVVCGVVFRALSHVLFRLFLFFPVEIMMNTSFEQSRKVWM
jgi:hypothetical protein